MWLLKWKKLDSVGATTCPSLCHDYLNPQSFSASSLPLLSSVLYLWIPLATLEYDTTVGHLLQTEESQIGESYFS